MESTLPENERVSLHYDGRSIYFMMKTVVTKAFLHFIDISTKMPQMHPCALSPASYIIDTPFREQLEILTWVVFILVPLLFHEDLSSVNQYRLICASVYPVFEHAKYHAGVG